MAYLQFLNISFEIHLFLTDHVRLVIKVSLLCTSQVISYGFTSVLLNLLLTQDIRFPDLME